MGRSSWWEGAEAILDSPTGVGILGAEGPLQLQDKLASWWRTNSRVIVFEMALDGMSPHLLGCNGHLRVGAPLCSGPQETNALRVCPCSLLEWQSGDRGWQAQRRPANSGLRIIIASTFRCGKAPGGEGASPWLTPPGLSRRHQMLADPENPLSTAQGRLCTTPARRQAREGVSGALLSLMLLKCLGPRQAQGHLLVQDGGDYLHVIIFGWKPALNIHWKDSH